MEFTLLNTVGLVVLGLVAGLVAGLLGVGGGIIRVPALAVIFCLESPLLIKGIVFIDMVFTVSTSAFRHYRTGLALTAAVKRLVPTACLGLALGYLLSRSMPIKIFMAVFAFFLLYVVGQNIYRFIKPSSGEGKVWENDDLKGREWVAWIIGGPMGFLAGALGIGGGSIAGPSLQVFMGMPLKNAIACSALAMLPLAFVAIAFSTYDGLCGNFGCSLWVAVAAGGLMIPGSMAGAWVGASLTKILPVRIIRFVFALTLLVTSLQMLNKVFRG